MNVINSHSSSLCFGFVVAMCEPTVSPGLRYYTCAHKIWKENADFKVIYFLTEKFMLTVQTGLRQRLWKIFFRIQIFVTHLRWRCWKAAAYSFKHAHHEQSSYPLWLGCSAVTYTHARTHKHTLTHLHRHCNHVSCFVCECNIHPGVCEMLW